MKMRLFVALTAAALAHAPVATAAPGDLSADPDTWPVADTAPYTNADDPGWVFFVPGGFARGCGIAPDGTVGCDIVIRRNADGTVTDDYGIPGPPGFYACGEDLSRCPHPPLGANQVVAGPGEPARYVETSAPTFTRNVDVLQPGYRLVNGGSSCYVSAASPGGINCRTATGTGFLWSSWGGILEPAD